jgi:hypothetical protein
LLPARAGPIIIDLAARPSGFEFRPSMRVTFYSAVVLVAAGSVVMGLDWMSAPMPPMPTPKNVVFAPPPPPPPPRVAAAPTPAPGADQNPPVIPAPVASVAAPAPVAPPAAATAAAAKIRCDAGACAAAYRSFRESDCTYNPSSGPRRLCTKGDPAKFITVTPAKPAEEPAPVPAAGEPVAAAPEVPGSIMAPEPGTPSAAPPQCNVSACAAAYRSFRESDCTFNPSSGPRRLCEK